MRASVNVTDGVLRARQETVDVYTISNNGMPRKKRHFASFQLKLYDDDADRWLKIQEQAKLRTNNRITDTEINRRLLQLDPDTDGAVTESDVLMFQGPAAILRAEMAGRLAAKTKLRDVSSRKKRP